MANIVQLNCQGFRTILNVTKLIIQKFEPVALCWQELQVSEQQLSLHLDLKVIRT